jgi:D-serine deaminase-like pyridoxal phosphate-dependent protein
MPDTSLPAHLSALLGQGVHAIDTPTLVIDLDAMQRNLQRMAEFAARHNIKWRAHAKMHKCSALALLQMQHGAVGVCVQTVGEAEAMVAGGVTDVYISNEALAPQKLARAAGLATQLAAHGGRLAIAVDSPLGVARLAQALQQQQAGAAGGHPAMDVFVEIDVGQHRCGVQPGEPVLALAQQVGAQAPWLRLAGLQAYLGHAQHLRTPEQRKQAVDTALAQVAATRDLLAQHGIAVPLVTGAGTGTMVNEAASGLYGELQAGSFLFMDADYAANSWGAQQPAFEHALFVKSAIISAAPDHVVCDGGHKSHAIDTGMPKVVAGPGLAPLAYTNASDEHGVLRPTGEGRLPALDDTVWLIPGHCDPTVNLHDHMLGVAGGLTAGTVARIFQVDARGASR